MRIHNISPIVEHVLEIHPETRADDSVLYSIVCKNINPCIDSMRFDDVLENMKLFGIPPFESVSRARRKIQSNREELKPDKNVIDARYEKYKEVLDYVTD